MNELKTSNEEMEQVMWNRIIGGGEEKAILLSDLKQSAIEDIKLLRKNNNFCFTHNKKESICEEENGKEVRRIIKEEPEKLKDVKINYEVPDPSWTKAWKYIEEKNGKCLTFNEVEGYDGFDEISPIVDYLKWKLNISEEDLK